jgi:8-oxo-dGTP pyrophosphatase MutT (NUDIX family)
MMAPTSPSAPAALRTEAEFERQDAWPVAQRVADLREQFLAYARRWPDEAEEVAAFAAFLTDDTVPFTRQHLAGHFTGSAWVVSADGRRVLLTHHKKLACWLQLGGHADGDVCLARVALREAGEESGLTGLRVRPTLFDLDRHRIPARDQDREPEHWHYDVRFVVQAADETFTVSEESHDLAWVDIQALADAPSTGSSLRRMAQKWLAEHSR